jgi:hypothetical protein
MEDSSGGASWEESDASMQLSASAPKDCTLLLSSDIGAKAAGLDLSNPGTQLERMVTGLHAAHACLARSGNRW